MTANIQRINPKRCTQDCRQWGDNRGAWAKVGDVRRCEHGRIYHCFWPEDSSNYGLWERLTPIRFILYPRAVKALAQ